MCTHNITSWVNTIVPCNNFTWIQTNSNFWRAPNFWWKKAKTGGSWTDGNHLWTEPAISEQQGLFGQGTAGFTWQIYSQGGLQLNGITVHNTYSTLKKIGEGWVSPGFGICRALRSDCLFPSMHFGYGSAGNAIGSRGRRGSYGTVQATQTNPNTHICFNTKCTLIQTERELKKSSNNACQIVKEIQVNSRGVWAMTALYDWRTFELPVPGLGLQGRQHNIYISACCFVSPLNKSSWNNRGVKCQFGLSVQAEVGQIHIHIVTILKHNALKTALNIKKEKK